MLNATVGARQVIDRLRSGLRDQGPRAASLRRTGRRLGANRLSRHAPSVARPAPDTSHASRAADRRLAEARKLPVRTFLGRLLASERVLPVGVVLLILFSSILSFAPLGARAVGSTDGDAAAAAHRGRRPERRPGRAAS